MAPEGIERVEPIIVVLGPFGGGTSAVAGILHHLGVHLGTHFDRLERHPPETWEEVRLGDLCRAAFREPEGTFRMDPEVFDRRLRDWADEHRRTARARDRPPGAKHPSLCLTVPRLREQWRAIVPVVVRRAVHEVVASLRRSGWWTEEQRVATTTNLVEARDRALSGHHTVEIDFARLRADARATIGTLADDLGLRPSADCLAAAAASVVA